MSFDEGHESSSALGFEGGQDQIQQIYEDSRSPSSGIGSPTPRGTQINGYAQTAFNSNGSLHPTDTMSSYFAEREPINNAVASAFHTTASDMSPDLIKLITQNVIQQLQAHKTGATPFSQPVQPPTSAPADRPTSPPSIQTSPNLGRATVYTPPSPHSSGERPMEPRNMPMSSSTSGLNTHGYNTARRRDLSPFSHTSNDEAPSSDAEQRANRSVPRKRSSVGSDETVIEKHWGRLFDEHGQATEKLAHFLQGIAVHLIEQYEPRNSLVVTPEKMQKYYDTTSLEKLPELYPWRHIFDDKSSYISRFMREIEVQHHLVQSSPDARPDIPGLTPLGFATWMTLLIRAHPNQESERLAKTLRIMAINHPERKTERFPAAISRRLFPNEGDESIAIRLTSLMAKHCHVQINPRHDSLTSTMGHENLSQPPVKSPTSPRKSEAPPPPTVEDVIDESERHESATKRSSFISTADSTSSRLRETVSNPDSEPTKAPSVTSIEDEGPEPYNTQTPLERQRKPYVAQPGGGKNYDVTSSGDETPKASVLSTSDMKRTRSGSSSHRSRPPAPIAIHQRGSMQAPQQDGADLTRARTSVPTSEPFEQTTVHRSRSNSMYGPPPKLGRSRSNSTYTNPAGGRYHAKRSPSLSKSGFEPFVQRGNGSEAPYSNYSSSNNTSYPINPGSQVQPQAQQQPAPERHESNARRQPYDPRNDPRYDPRNEPRNEPRGDPRGDPRNDYRSERSYDPGVRGSRQRHQSVAAVEGTRYSEENYRDRQAYPGISPNSGDATGVSHQYPPNAYRDGGR